MQKRYQIDKQRAVQQFRRFAAEMNPNIQMVLPLAGIVGLLQEGVGNLMRAFGPKTQPLHSRPSGVECRRRIKPHVLRVGLGQT